MLKSKMSMFAFVLCGCSEPIPEPLIQTATEPPKTMPPPKENGPECKALFSGYNSFCEKRAGDELCASLTPAITRLRSDNTEDLCSELVRSMIPSVKAGYGETPWGLIVGEPKLPQTFSPEKLPDNFIKESDGFDRIVEKPEKGFFGASSEILFAFPGLKTPSGQRVGFRLFFFEYQSDLNLLQKAMQKGEFRWALTKDNLLLVLPRVMSASSAESHMKEMAKTLGAVLHEPSSALPIGVEIELLSKEFKENEIKAEAKYKDQKIIGGGKVELVRRTMTGEASLVFASGGFGLFGASCLFSKEKEKDLALLETGSTAIVEGVVVGKGPATVQLNDCSLLAYKDPKK